MKTKIICFTLLLIFLTSCNIIQTKKEQITVPEVHTGTQGIVLEFLPNLPPSQLYENNFFEVMLKVSNKGAADAQRGMLIIGTEEQQIDLEAETDYRFDLKGKSVFDPEGTFLLKQFNAKVRPLIPQISQYTTSITATACYPYKTEATANICIDTDIADIVRSKPCKPAKKIYGTGQGAPVAVTSVEPKMLTHEDSTKIRPEFEITVRNLGPGKAIKKEYIYDACMGKPVGQQGQKVWDVVEVKATLSDKELNCRPETIILTKEDTTIICTLDEGIDKSAGTYLAPLSIEINYGYMNREIKKITIKRLEQNI